jgi:hypothetical protein
MSYRSDRKWSDRFLPAIKGIVGPYLLEESSYEVDTQQASDLVVMQAGAVSIACRIRRQGFADRYTHEFTVRAMRETGAKTELEKVIDGWADWMFYGHVEDAARPGLGFSLWHLIDLRAWRAHLIRRPEILRDAPTIPNGDGTYFKAFDLTTFDGDPPILIASNLDHYLEGRGAA